MAAAANAEGGEEAVRQAAAATLAIVGIGLAVYGLGALNRRVVGVGGLVMLAGLFWLRSVTAKRKGSKVSYR